MTELTVSLSSVSVRSAWLARPIGAMSWGLESWPVESVRLRTSGGTKWRILGDLGNGSPAAQLFLPISSVSSGSRLPPPPAPRKWWQRKGPLVSPHIGVVAPTKLITKTATELKPGRFLLYMAMLMILLVGLSAMTVFVPSASVTLIAQAAPFSQRDVEIQAEPGKAPIRVRVSQISRTDSQGFKTTGVKQVPLAPALAQVVYTNDLSQPKVCPAQGCSPGLIFPRGQRLKDNKDSLEFAQISPDTLVKWKSTATVTVQAVLPGTVGNVGGNVITAIEDLVYDPSKVTATNPQAAGGGTDPSTTPLMTESDFDAGRAQLEQSLHQEIAQQLEAGLQKG